MLTKRKAKLRKMILYQEYVIFCLKRELGLNEDKQMAEELKTFEVNFHAGTQQAMHTVEVEADKVTLNTSGDLQFFKGNELVAAFRSWDGFTQLGNKEEE